MKYLPQATIVEELLSVVDAALPEIKCEKSKQSVLKALNSFKKSATFSAVHVNEVIEIAQSNGVKLSNPQAIRVLQEVLLDIDSNYLNKAIEENVMQYTLGF